MCLVSVGMRMYINENKMWCERKTHTQTHIRVDKTNKQLKLRLLKLKC